MASQRRSAMAILGVMAGISFLGTWARPTKRIADDKSRADLVSMFPAEFGNWKIDPNTPVVVPSPDVQATINKIYNSVLARTYVNDQGLRLMLSVAYGGDKGEGGMSIHRPEICYPAQGFRIKASSVGNITLRGKQLPVRRLLTQLGGRVEPLTYWVLVGDEAVDSGTAQKIIEMRYGLRNLIPDGYLVRVSAIDSDANQAWSNQEIFLRELVAAMSPTAAEAILGRPPQVTG